MTMQREMLNLSSSTPLTNDEIFKLAPSVFATAPDLEVSDRYQFVPTIEIIDAMRNEGWDVVDASQRAVRKKGKSKMTTKHLLRFRRTRNPLKIEDDFIDAIYTGAHDRTSSAKMLASVWRMACANGCMTSIGNYGDFTIRHTGDAVRDVIEGTYEVIDQAPLIANSVNDMKAIDLLPDERKLFALTAFDYMNPQPAEDDENAPRILTNRDNIAAQILRPKRSADTGTDLWTTFNVIQEKAIRGGITTHNSSTKSRSGYRRSTSRAIKSIDKNVSLNQALWSMAEKMKELKS